jgi:hypothetical protein
MVSDPTRAEAWGHFIPFLGDASFGTPEPVPTPFDLGDRPRGCTAAERADTPRTNVPFMVDGRPMFPGERHPVLVREPRAKNAVTVDEPFVLITSGSVLQGTPRAPCVAAWEAPAVGRAPAAAVIQGDLAHAWLFRFTAESARAAPPRRQDSEVVPALEYRAMACRYDPGARVPDAIWNEPGTTRP